MCVLFSNNCQVSVYFGNGNLEMFVYFAPYIYYRIVGLGGLVVRVLTIGSKVRGFEPGRG
jgi:hypothetical protein